MAGFEERRLSSDTDELVAYDHGAHVAHWAHRGVPVVWVSESARYEEGTAIRGGVPVCWPWFAAGPDGDLSPSHGLARTRRWRLTRHEEAVLGWQLTHEDLDEQARGAFEPEFACDLTVRLGPGRLEISLEVSNPGTDTFTYEAALHTYLHVGDVREMSVEGLDAVTYYDKVRQRQERQVGDVRISGAEDRIYFSPRPSRVRDPRLGRELVVSSTGAANTVIWNPGPEGAHEMGDFSDEEWTQVVCVETACVGSSAVSVAPGTSQVMTARVDVDA